MSRYVDKLQYSSDETTEEYSDETEPVKLYSPEDLERLMASDNESRKQTTEELVIDDISENTTETSETQKTSEEQEESNKEIGWEEDYEPGKRTIEQNSSNRFYKGLLYSTFMAFTVMGFFIIQNSTTTHDVLTFLKW